MRHGLENFYEKHVKEHIDHAASRLKRRRDAVSRGEHGCEDAAAPDGPPLTRLEALEGWGMFMLCLGAAWDSAIGTAMDAVADETERLAEPDAKPLTRGYVLALAVFTVMRAMFLLGLALIMLYALLSLVNIVAPFLSGASFLRAPLYNLSRAHILFQPLSPVHLTFHGVVLLTLLLCAFAMTAVYLRASDLRDRDRARAKCTHVVCAMAAITGIAYLAYAALQVLQASAGAGEDAAGGAGGKQEGQHPP